MSSIPGRAYGLGIDINKLLSGVTRSDLGHGLRKGGKHGESKVYQSLLRRTPRFERDWTSSVNLSDYFNMLIVNYRRFPWTQQWSLGCTAWGLFVGVECTFEKLL